MPHVSKLSNAKAIFFFYRIRINAATLNRFISPLTTMFKYANLSSNLMTWDKRSAQLYVFHIKLVQKKIFIPFEIQSQRQVRSPEVIKHHNLCQVVLLLCGQRNSSPLPDLSEKTLFPSPWPGTQRCQEWGEWPSRREGTGKLKKAAKTGDMFASRSITTFFDCPFFFFYPPWTIMFKFLLGEALLNILLTLLP